MMPPRLENRGGNLKDYGPAAWLNTNPKQWEFMAGPF